MNLQGKKITVHDMTLRDGMHPKRHQMTLEQMASIATGLDAAGVPLIEVTHGDGLGGSSVNYGFPAHSDEEYLSTVIPKMKQAKVSALLLPGIGTVDHLKMAKDLGVHTIRVATHCTEADVSEQHITAARKLEMDTVGFLMMAHMNSPREAGDPGQADGELRRQLRLRDRLGRLHAARRRDGAAAGGARRAQARDRAGLPRPPQPGHGRGQLGRRGGSRANRIDAAAGLGAGAGNTPMEVFIAVCDRMGIETGVDVFKIQDVAEDLVVPIMDHIIRVDRDSLTLGYAGVYSSFLLFAKRAEKKYGIPAREILVELGRRGMVGGQEDMIEDTALTLSKQRAAVAQAA
jgi:4-hydroxy-2-oxovalerate/4-hydroxy-2-oxohexanoate aldolase